MRIRLTLTVESEIIARAKLYAKNTGRSLSEIVENYLQAITEETGSAELSPMLKKIAGAVKLPKKFNAKKELRDHFRKKHQ